MAIDTINEAMDVYNNAVDQAIPWEKLKEVAFELGKFESKLVSKQSTDQIINIKTQLLTAIDKYDTSTQSIYEGCSSSTLSTYVRLFDSPESDALATQKNLLIRLLDNATEHLKKAQKDLVKTLATFYSLYDNFRALLNQLKIDHNEHGDHFNNKKDKIVAQKFTILSVFNRWELEKEAVGELKEKVKPIQTYYKDIFEKFRQAVISLGTFTHLLGKNLQLIRLQKTQVSKTNATDALKSRDDIVRSVKELEAKCQEYRQRHQNI